MRRHVAANQYRVTPLGPADDAKDANGTTVLNFDQATAKARAMVETPDGGKIQRITVRQAFAAYIEHKQHLGQNMTDVISRGTVHILPTLGDFVISELTAETLRRWLFNMAISPAQSRPKDGKAQFRAAPKGDEAIRRRRSSANRVLGMLKAVLNWAYDEGHVKHRDAWGRKVKPFRDVDMARVRYLTIAEAQRIVNAAEPLFFRPLVRAALETGARYSELGRLQVVDFNSDSGTLAVRKSKVHKARHIVLTDEGADFFRTHCAGRAGSALMFPHDEAGTGWKPSQQNRPMKAANRNAKLNPPIGFHGLRHTWASHAVMNGVPLLVVAKNLGHTDTKMVEQHYGHLAPSYIVDAIRAGAPKYGVDADKKVVPLR